MNKQAVLINPQPEPAQSPFGLIELAIKSGAQVDQLERLMALQERWSAQQAKTAYYEAIAEFQASCPILKKTKEVDYESKKTGQKTNYKYAPLSEIVETIREPLKESGLSYRWEIEDKERIVVTCIVTHKAGHAERTSMSAEPDDSGAKNQIQQRGSSVTYLQRYTLIGGLGITSADTDDDGKSSGALNVERLMAHNVAVREHFDSVYCIKTMLAEDNYSAAAEAWVELSDEIKGALWLATTKGGVFTTLERDKLKSNEMAEARRAFTGGDEQKGE